MPHQHQQHLKMEKSRAKFYFSFPSGFKFASVWTAFTAKRYVWGRSFGSKNFLIIVSNAGARLLALLHQWTLRFSSLSVFFIPRFVERKTNESFVSAAVRVFCYLVTWRIASGLNLYNLSATVTSHAKGMEKRFAVWTRRQNVARDSHTWNPRIKCSLMNL